MFPQLPTYFEPCSRPLTGLLYVDCFVESLPLASKAPLCGSQLCFYVIMSLKGSEIANSSFLLKNQSRLLSKWMVSPQPTSAISPPRCRHFLRFPLLQSLYRPLGPFQTIKSHLYSKAYYHFPGVLLKILPLELRDFFSNSLHYFLKTVINHVFFPCLITFFFFFGLSRAAPMAYGGSQARSLTGALAAGLCQSHSNAASVTTPQQCQILNPLSEARGRTRNHMVPSRVRFRCTTKGTPGLITIYTHAYIIYKYVWTYTRMLQTNRL